jgi:multiple sugar transport system permease protein
MTIEAANAASVGLLAAPSLALLFLVILFPVLWALFTSVHDYTLIAPNFDTFTGFKLQNSAN